MFRKCEVEEKPAQEPREERAYENTEFGVIQKLWEIGIAGTERKICNE